MDAVLPPDRAAATWLAVGVLGPLEVRRRGRPVDLGPPKQRAVLACLALARGRVVSAERLLRVLWGDQPPSQARANLQVYVSRLRSLLRDESSGVSPVSRRAPGYLLDLAPGQLDADRFVALAEEAQQAVREGRWAQAVTLAAEARNTWRGGVLDDLGDEAWFRSDADAWERRRADVGCALVVARLGQRRPAEAAAAARALSAESPLGDETTRLLMLALHQAGRTVEALDTYTRHAARLDEELGIEPAPGVRDLHVALLRQDGWTLDWPVSPDRPAGTARTAPETPRPVGLLHPPDPPDPQRLREPDGFVGRDDERAHARELIDRVTDPDPMRRTGRVLVLTGPAGIGKTRLAEEVLAAFSQRGGTTARGRCLEEDGAPVWWPLRQVARDLGADPDRLLSAPAEAADTQRFAIYERVRDLLVARSTEAPLAVLVDDLQWADRNSAGALAYLATSLGSAPVLLVATVRDAGSETGSGVGVLRDAAALLRANGARHLALPPLAPSEIVRLAGQVAGVELEPDEAAALVAHTGGNALFVCEYARLPRPQRESGVVPLAVRGVLDRRIGTLGSDVLAALQVAAVLGDVLDLGLVSEVAATTRDDLVDLLDRAADAAVIVPRLGGEGYGFAHALLRDQVLHGLSPLRLQQLHARVAAALTTAGGERVSQRAQHLVAAGSLADPRDTLEACRAAALQAEQRMSSETAVGWWDQARTALDRLPDQEQDPQERDDLVVAAVEALTRAGRAQSVLDRLDRALVDAVLRDRPTTAGRLAATLLRVSGTWPWAVFGDDPAPLLDRLDATVPFVADDVAASARVLAALAVGRCYDPDPSVPDRLSRRALSLAEECSDLDVLADALIGRVTTYVGDATHADEAEELLDRLVALPRVGADADLVLAHSARTMSLLVRGDVSGVEHHLRAGVAGADRLKLRDVRAQLRWMGVGLHHWHHGAASALDKHAEAVEAHRRTELYDGGFGDLVRRVLLLDAGRLGEVADHGRFETLVWGAAGAAARGDLERAARLVEQRLQQPFVASWSTLAHLMVVAGLVADLDATDLAPVVLDLLDPHAGRLASLGQGPVLGPVDAARARLLAQLGDHDAAGEALSGARDLCARNGGAPWVARCDRIAVDLTRMRVARPC